MNILIHQWPDNFKLRQYLCFGDGLPEYAWQHWADHYKENWPSDPVHRLAMIDDEIAAHLRPQDLRPESVRDRRRYMRATPDLNKHRGWVLSLAVNQLKKIADNQMDKREAYIFPKDLKVLAQDIAIFEKNRDDPEFYGREKYSFKTFRHLTLKNYPSGSDLLKYALPRRVRYPLKAGDRLACHKKFLFEEGGNGHAVRLASFNDGTEIIMPLTFESSKAYGSPRWCSVYSEAFFDKHSQREPLCIIIDGDGRRWQLGFKSFSLSDEEDVITSLEKIPQNAASFLQTREGDIIVSALEKHLNQLSETELELASLAFFSVIKMPDLFISLIQRETLVPQIINAKDKNGNTALDLIRNNACSDVIKMAEDAFKPHQNDKRPIFHLAPCLQGHSL